MLVLDRAYLINWIDNSKEFSSRLNSGQTRFERQILF